METARSVSTSVPDLRQFYQLVLELARGVVNQGHETATDALSQDPAKTTGDTS